MADEFQFNVLIDRADRRRYVRLAVTALLVLGVAGLLGALVRPVFAQKHRPSPPVYVSLISHGQLQVCRVTPRRTICPPLSASPSKSYSPSKSKSVSTSTSLVPPSKSVSTSTSLSPSVRTR